MSTEYLVKCPHFGCGWYGHLVPNRAVDSWTVFEPTGTIVAFECPVCLEEWRARVIDGEAEALPLDNTDDDVDTMEWPPLELGVGD